MDSSRSYYTLKIVLLYGFLLFGGLWQVLGKFQTLMSWGAAPMIIFIASWLFWEYCNLPGMTKENRLVFYRWSAMVIFITFWIEWAGVKTGIIFGSYDYGVILQPQIFGIPIAIGFAWLGMLLASSAVARFFFPVQYRHSDFRAALLIGIVMVLFDAAMEPVATKLSYWSWEGGRIPWQNYLSWFLISFAISLIGMKFKILKFQPPPIAFHAYWAQLIYFAIVGLS